MVKTKSGTKAGQVIPVTKKELKELTEKANKQVEVKIKGVKDPTISDINSIRKHEVLHVIDAPFNIRRIHGGFAYEYDSGAVLFVSTNELVTD